MVKDNFHRICVEGSGESEHYNQKVSTIDRVCLIFIPKPVHSWKDQQTFHKGMSNTCSLSNGWVTGFSLHTHLVRASNSI